MESLPLTVHSGGSLSCFSSHSSFSNSRSTTVLKWGLQRNQDMSLKNLGTRKMKGRGFRVLVNPNVSPGKGNPKGEIIMVDPSEAKRLAAKQMQEIKAKEKLERQRQIEATNGAWAMIGLTAGLVIEGHTGNSIVTQLAGYWSTIQSFLAQQSLLNGFFDPEHSLLNDFLDRGHSLVNWVNPDA
ncbi:hypothetical protein BVC80_729g15 [Macleaya cordata]|uniref:Chlorophyll A-B binding protein n=1 Tax=Macleaya cordata TaxID=56857 RepID=A0A200PSL0_MACCD|nr:hypothetical protein BVC80_729g15 [Macleaya cordata]